MKAYPARGPPVLCEDVLYRIFKIIAQYNHRFRDLAVAARVCRTWTYPAQVAMYSTFTFYTEMIKNSRWDSFILSVEAHPHLRPLLRHLTLWQFSDTTETRVNWMRLLPAHGLKSFECSWRVHKPLLSMFDIPAVRTVTQLNIAGQMTPAIVKTCCEFPHLQTLCITFYRSCSDDWDVELTPPLSLKHLVVIVLSSFDIPSAYRLIAACAPQLSTFALNAPFSTMQEYGVHIADTLVLRTGELTELSLFGTWWMWSPTQSFMDDFVLSNRHLERICCIEGTYSETLFQRLPATLQVLELAICEPPYPCERALVEYIARVKTEGCGLRRLCLRAPRMDEEPWRHIRAMCEESGVEFGVEGYRENLGRARGREWCA